MKASAIIFMAFQHTLLFHCFFILIFTITLHEVGSTEALSYTFLKSTCTVFSIPSICQCRVPNVVKMKLKLVRPDFILMKPCWPLVLGIFLSEFTNDMLLMC